MRQQIKGKAFWQNLRGLALAPLLALGFLLADGSLEACEWQSSIREGCDRIDIYSCPAYVDVGGRLIYIGEYEWEDIKPGFYCLLV